MSAASANQFTLSDFNGVGFDWTFDGFTQAVGPAAVRLTDPLDASGGAGVSVGSLDLSPYSGGRFVAEVTTQPGHEASGLLLQLIDQDDDSANWPLSLTTLTAGQPTTLVTNTTLAETASQHAVDLSRIATWQVLGDYVSDAPFDIALDSLTVSTTVDAPPPYLGFEPDAAWRDEARQRIDSIRKSNLVVRVIDAAGNAVPGATVHAAMREHAFGFGSAIQGFRLRDEAPQHATYKQRVADLFNIATFENNLKWLPWEGEWGGDFTQAGADAALDWLVSQGIRPRGHVMVWPGRDNLPADIRSLLDAGPLSPSDQQYVRDRIAAHIASQGAAADGRIVSWDVINETRTNFDLMDQLSEGDQAMVTWFQLAAQHAPGVDLYLNDFGILTSGGDTDSPNQAAMIADAEFLIANGAPIDGVGLQGHFSEGNLTGPEQLWDILDRFAALDLNIQITEFDFATTDEALQAQFTRDFMTAVFAHEGVSDFITWGFWEEAIFQRDAAMFRSDWSIKPNGEAYVDLVFQEWWTDEFTSTGLDGASAVRGFHGDYEIGVEWGELSSVAAAQLGPDGETVTIQLETLVGDFNGDGAVDLADYTVWRDTLGSTQSLQADANNDGLIDAQDYALWSAAYGAATLSTSLAAPTPTSGALLAALLIGLTTRGRIAAPNAVRDR